VDGVTVDLVYTSDSEQWIGTFNMCNIDNVTLTLSKCTTSDPDALDWGLDVSGCAHTAQPEMNNELTCDPFELIWNAISLVESCCGFPSDVYDITIAPVPVV
jgi:hypothetical protein